MEREAETTELKKWLVSEESPEERQALVDEGAKGARAIYGLDVPRNIEVLCKEAVTTYSADYEDHEADLLRHTRSEGGTSY